LQLNGVQEFIWVVNFDKFFKKNYLVNFLVYEIGTCHHWHHYKLTSLSTPADEPITQQLRAVCSGLLLLSRVQMLLEGVNVS
jgi:hypothetical protein